MSIKSITKLTEKKVLALPPIIYLVALFLIPALIMISIAFRQPGNYGGVAPLVEHANTGAHLTFTLDSFKFTFTSKFIWQLCLRSLEFSIITTLCCLILGYPMAMLIAKSKQKYRDKLLLLVIIPFWSCFLIRIYAWMIILGPSSGVNHLINQVIIFLGYPPSNLLY